MKVLKTHSTLEILESRQLLSSTAGAEEKQVKDISCSEIKESIKGTLETWTLFGTNTAVCIAGNLLGSATGNDKFKLDGRYVGKTIGSCILEGMVFTGLKGSRLDPVEITIFNLAINLCVGGIRR